MDQATAESSSWDVGGAESDGTYSEVETEYDAPSFNGTGKGNRYSSDS